jgi:hypothetical protein
MLRILLFFSTLFLLGAACVVTPPPPVMVEPLAKPVSFLADVKPVLDQRCVVCHSCYNAACQLKLSSYEGVERGGSKLAVYSSSRIRPQTPTRLFFDAQTPEEWRGLDFHSVIQSQAPSPANDATMLYLLEAKRLEPRPAGEYRPEAANLSCPANPTEVGSFIAKNPAGGMPFGFPALSAGEHAILTTWLAQGAPGPTADEQAALTTPTEVDAAQIAKWEAFLNRDDAKHAMTARYLYEHFFLAHLHFAESDSGAFFQLVRSTTPPGEPVSVIATVRPYDPPGVETFYYRFRKIHSTIVQKTHMVVELGDERLARYRELFIDSVWLGEPHRMAFEEVADANPFLVYAQIPPRVRYQFLLDHAEYVIRTFIRGPVCKGQVALNVIHDHFWVMFMDPSADRGVRHPEFLIEQAGNLRLPVEAGSDKKIIKAFSDDYRKRYADFYNAKMALYDRRDPEGLGLDSIWPGRVESDAPLLTIYRHFDSASVHKGALGDLPRTLWLIDYAQFERIYYALVAGFDVFGNLSHQVNVRRYMDYLRMEGELNFVQLLPVDVRVSTFNSWYIGKGAIEDTRSEEILTGRGTRIEYETDDPKRELVERVIKERLIESVGIGFDDINYHREGRQVSMPASFRTHEDVLDGLRALTAPGTAFIRHLNGTQVNVLFLRVRDYQDEDRFVTIVINRWHDNVNSLFFEKARLDSSKDTMDFHDYGIGSYPNYFLDVAAEELPDFFEMLANFDGSPEYVAKLDHYGVNRAEGHFWELYDWFQAKRFEDDPIEAGLYDLNRYYSEASD